MRARRQGRGRPRPRPAPATHRRRAGLGALALLASAAAGLPASAAGAGCGAAAAPASAAAAAEAAELHARLRGSSDLDLSPALTRGLGAVEAALRLFGHGQVFAAFNGGKDAVAALHLYRAALARHFQERGTPMMRPRVLVLAVQDDFGEVQELIRHTVARYELQAVTLEGGLIAGLADCVRDHALARSASATAAAGSSAAEAEGLPLAWVMGTREGDPHGSDLETFSPTSEWMPPGMRVNPILRWDYGQVWSFLRGFELPYCSLYDFGYTSIGSVGDTFPNPFLRSNSSAPPGYLPAYLLPREHWGQERAGRSPGRPSAPARAEVAAAGREL